MTAGGDRTGEETGPDARAGTRGTPAGRGAPSAAQRAWLVRGLDQPGGKLPLFDRQGREIPRRTVESCIARGWAEPWIDNPVKPDWLVCRLTDAGRAAVRPGAPSPTSDGQG